MTRLIRMSCVGLALAAFATGAGAQDGDPRQALLDRLLGQWQGTGVTEGRDTEANLQWEKALDGHFVKLTYAYTRTPGRTPAAFEGHAYYAASGATATWFDSYGQMHPIRVEAEDNALIAHWGHEGGTQGITEYRLHDDGGLQVIDRIRTSNGWVQFGDVSYERRGGQQ